MMMEMEVRVKKVKKWMEVEREADVRLDSVCVVNREDRPFNCT